MCFHEFLGEGDNFIPEPIKQRYAFNRRLSLRRHFRITVCALGIHMLGDEQKALRRNLLPPPQRRRLLEGDVRQRRGTTVQKAPERRLAIDFQFFSLFSHQHAFLLEPPNNAHPPRETALIIPRSAESRQIGKLRHLLFDTLSFLRKA